MDRRVVVESALALLGPGPTDCALMVNRVSFGVLRDPKGVLLVPKTIRFSVSIEKDLIDAFDDLCSRRGWTNRSEAVRDAIRRQLVEQEWEAGEEVVGIVTLLYDHHAAGLDKQLTEIQHEALGIVISTTHVHIDERNCLECIAVRGEARQIEELAHGMIGLKGVKHGELVGTSTGKKIH